MSLELVKTEHLADLAHTANEEHHLVAKSMAQSIGHAIAAGEALLLARSLVSDEGLGWPGWVRANLDMAPVQAARYLRIAYFKDIVVEAGATSLANALTVLRQLEVPPLPAKRNAVYSSEFKKRIIELVESGRSQRSVESEFAIPPTTISAWMHPETRRRHDRARVSARMAAKRAAKREQKARAAKKVGGNIGRSYSLLRNLAEAFDKAISEEQDQAAASHLKTALLTLYRAEDALVKALGTSDPSVR